MKNFKLILVLNILGFLPSLVLAEDSLQSAVISKVSADHAAEMKSGNFSRRQGPNHASVSRSSAAAKNVVSPSVGSRPTLVAKAPLNEKREIAKRRANLVRR